MTPTTWEEAAREVANWIDLRYMSVERVTAYDPLHWAEFQLDKIRGGDTCDRWQMLVENALMGYCQLSDFKPNVALTMVLDTIISKQHDYGHDNILWGGVEGIVIRAHDKVARIKNLMKRQSEMSVSLPTSQDGTTLTVTPKNESLADSWLDLAGYGLIGMMLERGTFELPLTRDLARAIHEGNLVLRNGPADFTGAGGDGRDGYCIISDDDVQFEEHPECKGWYQYELQCDALNAGIAVAYCDDATDKVFVGGWNEMYGDLPDEWGFASPHGFYLSEAECIDLCVAIGQALDQISG